MVSQVLSQDEGYGALQIERKASDALLVLLEQDLDGFSAGNSSAADSVRSVLLEVKGAHGLSGVMVSAGKGSVLIGESSGLSAKKHFIASSGDGFVVGEVIVWE